MAVRGEGPEVEEELGEAWVHTQPCNGVDLSPPHPTNTTEGLPHTGYKRVAAGLVPVASTGSYRVGTHSTVMARDLCPTTLPVHSQ